MTSTDALTSSADFVLEAMRNSEDALAAWAELDRRMQADDKVSDLLHLHLCAISNALIALTLATMNQNDRAGTAAEEIAAGLPRR